MGFREDLDLTGIIDKYEEFGGRPEAGLPPYILEERERIRAEAQEEREKNPRPVGSGPLRCSTSRVLTPARPTFAWDPNWYYRDLGIPWPYVHATKKDLRLAYFDRDGQSSRRLTYCIKQLLRVREEYDALPLGEILLDDIYVQEALHQKAADEAQKRSSAGEYTTLEQILDGWGFALQPQAEEQQDTPEEALDINRFKRFDGARHEDCVGATWDYSFYQWRTSKWDTDRLAVWQSALISALDTGDVSSLAVGLVGKQPQDFVIGKVAGEWVAFLNVGAEVTEELVAKAAQQLITEHHSANAVHAPNTN